MILNLLPEEDIIDTELADDDLLKNTLSSENDHYTREARSLSGKEALEIVVNYLDAKLGGAKGAEWAGRVVKQMAG